MKKIIALFLVVISVCSFSSCKKESAFSSSNHKKQEITFASSDSLETIKLSSENYEAFCDYLDYNNINCPYSEIFGIKEAFSEKEKRGFDAEKHSYDFFEGNFLVEEDKLFKVVKENNAKYMEGIRKHFYDNLSDSKLKECCRIVADTINWGIENIDGIDLEELSCMIGNLKILNRGTMNLATFDDESDSINISPDIIDSKKERTGISNIYEMTVCHETMHLMQCRCTDVSQGEEDSFIGASYSFETLEINPLKISWLYEASAELNTAMKFNCEPTTYTYMIDNLESISLATVLNENVKARQLEKLCFTQDEETLYKQLEFEDKEKSAEFLYAVEILRNKPEDFKKAYEKTYGTLTEDYSEFIKKTYNPYFVEVVSKLLYKNLALKLTQNEICLNDVFYIISLYELDLLKDIPLDNLSVREKYKDTYEKYMELQKTFLEMLQKNTDLNIMDSFLEYQMNLDNGSLYANASLDWLEEEKAEYLLSRNNTLYDSGYTHLAKNSK